MSEQTEVDATLAQELAERFQGLSEKQLRCLAALTIRPSIPWASRAAKVSNVSLYRWLGRLPSRGGEAEKDEVFCEAYEVCCQMGREAVVDVGLGMAQAYDDNGKPAAQRLMSDVLKAFGPEFRNQGASVDLGNTTVKRVILERE